MHAHDAVFNEELERAYQKELRDTAYHEAGHAVLHVLFGIPFKTAEVFSDEHEPPKELEKDYVGIVRWDEDRSPLDYWPTWAVSGGTGFRARRAVNYWTPFICMSLAGAQAEGRAAGRAAERSVERLDWADIRFVGRDLVGLDAAQLRDWVSKLRPLTAATLGVPVVWAAVCAVAEALLQRWKLTAQEVEAITDAVCMPRFPGSRVRAPGFRAAARPAVRRLSSGLGRAINTQAPNKPVTRV